LGKPINSAQMTPGEAQKVQGEFEKMEEASRTWAGTTTELLQVIKVILEQGNLPSHTVRRIIDGELLLRFDESGKPCIEEIAEAPEADDEPPF